MAIVMHEKITFADLKNQQYFDLLALATNAGVKEAVIQAMLSGEPVERYQAELVLSALSDDTGEDYTLETVEVALIAEHDGEEPSS